MLNIGFKLPLKIPATLLSTVPAVAPATAIAGISTLEHQGYEIKRLLNTHLLAKLSLFDSPARVQLLLVHRFAPRVLVDLGTHTLAWSRQQTLAGHLSSKFAILVWCSQCLLIISSHAQQGLQASNIKVKSLQPASQNTWVCYAYACQSSVQSSSCETALYSM
jgi:hypothetical protein